jgi:uncharacterized repeat protein (TIGR01451 family)
VRFTSTFSGVNANQWYHVSLTYNNGVSIFYLDGVANPEMNTGFGSLAAHSDSSGLGFTNGSDAYGNSSNNYYNGLIDDVYHYPTTLSSTEIQEVINSITKECDATIDTDGDSIPDHLDLDSDGDGCPDSIEAGVSLTNTDLQTADIENGDGTNNTITSTANAQLNPNGTDINNDGLNDSVDINLDGNIDYLSTYTVYALSNAINSCTDTDEDSVPDILDIDDDNDGILDTDEGCEISFAPSGFDAYWPMDNSTNDQTNTYNSQSGTNTFSTDAKKGSYSVSFNGTSDGLRYSNGTFLNQEITNFTHSFWFKADDVNGTQTLLDEGGTVNGVGIRLENNSVVASVEEGSTRITRTFSGISANQWYHVALTYDNGNAVFYLDGTASAVINSGFGSLAAHSSDSGLGITNGGDAFGGNSSNHFDGLIDDVYHYPTTLSVLEIQEIIGSINILCKTITDTDGDSVPNHLDLDSDGDGCPDTLEAGVPITNTDLQTADIENGDGTVNTNKSTVNAQLNPNGTDDNNDGLNDSVDTAQDGEPDYTSTYISIALLDTQNACLVDLSLTKKVDKAVPKVGEEVIFTFTLKNNGLSDATGVQVKDMLPSGLTYVAINSVIPTNTTYSSITGIWDLGSIVVSMGDTLELKIAAIVSIKGQIIINQSEVFISNESDIDSIPNSSN